MDRPSRCTGQNDGIAEREGAMSENQLDYVVSDLEYNVITTLATLLQSEDVLERYTEDAREAGEEDIVALFTSLRQHHREVAQGLREALKRNLTHAEER
jgi:hypothetical protein